MKEDKIQDISELNHIISSRAYRRVLDERRDWLQKEANVCIRKQDWYGAFSAIARMDDLWTTLRMLEKSLEDLKKGKQ